MLLIGAIEWSEKPRNVAGHLRFQTGAFFGCRVARVVWRDQNPNQCSLIVGIGYVIGGACCGSGAMCGSEWGKNSEALVQLRNERGGRKGGDGGLDNSCG